MVIIKNLQDAYNLFNDLNIKVYGVGVTSFMRIIPTFFLKDNFEIFCYKDSLDNEFLQKYSKIISIQKLSPLEILPKLNSSNILMTKYISDYVSQKDKKNSYIYVYKSSKEIERIVDTMGFNLIANRTEIRDKYENKKYFRELLGQLGIEPITGENMSYDNFKNQTYKNLSEKYGPNIVIQLPDIKNGGGLGTFFINSEKDFIDVSQKISLKSTEIEINTVNITKFIKGISSSITACATQKGTFTTNVQTQIIDITEVINVNKGNGLFCGHDWSFNHYSSKVNQKASDIAKKIGEYIYTQGYKGIFGLDLIVDIDNDDVYVVECNPRYTGAFPMISLIDIKNGIIPLDVFHIIEFLGIDVDYDFDSIDKSYKYDREGSHIILNNIYKEELTIKSELPVGVYTMQDGEILYLREGSFYSDIQNNNEFVITDGNPKKGTKIRGYSELSRICHLLLPKSIIKSNNIITKETIEIIEKIYNKIKN